MDLSAVTYLKIIVKYHEQRIPPAFNELALNEIEIKPLRIK